MRIFSTLVVVILCGTQILLSQQTTSLDSIQQLESVYIDSKINTDRKNSGKTVTVISSETLQKNVGKSVAQVLNEVAGFEMNGSNSNNGQTLGYFVRGGRNRQVVVLMDGIPLTDASHISNEYDFRLLSLENIEKIEIMKGASSVLYGSGAATAVISITTKKASKKPIKVTTSSMFGTDRSAEDDKYPIESLTNAVSVSGTINKFFYQAEANHRYSRGLSAIEAPEDAEMPFEADIYNNFNSKVNLGFNINDNITISQFVTFDKFRTGFDDFSYTDVNNISEIEQFRTGGHFKWKYNKGVYVFNDNFSSIKRELSSSFPAKYDSKSYNFDTYLQYNISNAIKTIVGLNGNFSSMNSFTIPFGETQFAQDVDSETANFNYFDPYLNFLVSYGGFNVNAGARFNIHSLYGNQLVYQVNPSYNFDISNFNLKVLGSYSTAYITPSLFQIYDPLYGNEELQPEENATIEGGVEVSNGKGFRVSAIYFQRTEENFVDFVTVDPELFIFQYQNIADSFEASGIEVELTAPITEELSFNANYTNTQADERFALRIPEHKANAFLNYVPDTKSNLGLSFQYVSDRDDNFFNPETFESETVVLDSYTLLNFTASRQFTNSIKVFLAVDNIMDTDFEELFRYQTRGRNIRLGFGLNF